MCPGCRVSPWSSGGTGRCGGSRRARRCDHGGVEVAAADLVELMRGAVTAHRRMWTSASRMTDDDCRVLSLLPGWSRGHVLAHWARNADGQTRMLLAAQCGEVTAQYPGGDAQREADIETGASRPARLILQDARVAVDRVEDTWRRMPPRGLVPADGRPHRAASRLEVSMGAVAGDRNPSRRPGRRLHAPPLARRVREPDASQGPANARHTAGRQPPAFPRPASTDRPEVLAGLRGPANLPRVQWPHRRKRPWR